MHPFIYQLCAFLLLTCLSCKAKVPPGSQLPHYQLQKPDLRLVLPDTLREISGHTIIDSNTIACIQDENGILFLYDIHLNRIKHQYQFGLDGDYEGITLVGKDIYVLRSDGIIYEIVDFQSQNFKVNFYETGIPANNNEGLCYDSKSNRLLIACKGKIGKGPAYKDRRLIYGFDLNTKKLRKEPVHEFDLQDIKNFANHQKINLPTRSKRGGKVIEPIIRFATSAINIHPITGDLYLLSATDHLLFLFDSTGTPKHIEVLDSDTFNKAEGIAFFPSGDMLISNEAQNKQATLLRFNYVEE